MSGFDFKFYHLGVAYIGSFFGDDICEFFKEVFDDGLDDKVFFFEGKQFV